MNDEERGYHEKSGNRIAGGTYHEVHQGDMHVGSAADDIVKILNTMKGDLSEFDLDQRDQMRAIHHIDGAIIETKAETIDKAALENELKGVYDIAKDKTKIPFKETKLWDGIKKGLKWAGIVTSWLV